MLREIRNDKAKRRMHRQVLRPTIVSRLAKYAMCLTLVRGDLIAVLLAAIVRLGATRCHNITYISCQVKK